MLDSYISPFIDNIRSVLGIDDIELLEDTVIESEVYELRLEESLADIHTELLSDFNTLKVLASPTTDEAAVVRGVKLYSVYAIADMLCDSLPIFSPRTIGDGKAFKTRYSNDPYKATMERIKVAADSYKSKMIAAYNTYKGTSIVTGSIPVPIGNAVPDIDIVTNA